MRILKAMKTENGQSSDVLLVVKYPIMRVLIISLFVFLLMLFFVLFLFKDLNIYIILMIVFWLPFQYLFSTQFQVTNIVLTEAEIVVTFPVSFFLKRKKISLNEIDYFYFNFNPGARGMSYCKIYFKKGGVYKFFCAGEFHLLPLIEILQKNDIEVKVSFPHE